MESINSQIGQTFAGGFASNSTVNRAGNQDGQSVQRERSLQTAQTVNDAANVEQQRNVNNELQRFNEAASTAQERTLAADSINSEQQNNTLELEVATREIEQFLQAQNRNLAFSVDESTNRPVVTVTDSGSGDVIRQIPSEEVLRLAERLDDLRADVGSSVGVLFNNQV